MGEDYPKVENLENLSNYATQVMTFAEDYTAAANETYRTYTLSTSSQYGEAIQAFLNKLQSIQSQVFDQFPLALETYGSTVATYYAGLTDLGFNKRMWSSLDGATSLENLYNSHQANLIDEVSSRLQDALDFAAEAADYPAPNLSRFTEIAKTDFSDAGKKRHDKATAVNELWSSFTTNLAANSASINSFQTVLKTARYLGGMPAENVFKAIRSGDLEADEMYYFDNIATKEDAKALKVIFGEDYKNGDSPQKFAALANSGNISKGMYDVLADEMTDWMEKGEAIGGTNRYTEKLNSLFKGFNRNDQDSNYGIFQELLEAGDRRAYLLTTEMFATYDQNPNSLNSEEMKTKQKRLYAINDLLGLFNSAAYLEVGIKTWNDYIESSSEQQHYYVYEKDVTLEGFKFDSMSNHGSPDSVSGGINFTWKSVETSQFMLYYKNYNIRNPVGKKEVRTEGGDLKSHEVYTNTEILAASDASKYEELQESRKKALEDFHKKVLKAVAAGVLTAINPYAGLTFSAVSALSENDYSGAYSTAAGGVSIPNSTQKETFSSLASIAFDYINYTNEIELINGREDKIGKEAASAKNSYLDRGGWILENPSKAGAVKTYSGAFYYDFNAMLRAREMDNNGVVNYIMNNSSGVVGDDKQPFTSRDDAINYIRSEIKHEVKDADEDVIDYLCGESDKKLSDLTPTQIVKISTYLNVLQTSGGGSSEYRNYLAEQFEYNYNPEGQS